MPHAIIHRVALLSLLALSVLALSVLAQSGRAQPLPACEWCGADEAPDSLTATTTIPTPGERLRLTGLVMSAEGAPMVDVLTYASHTNASGTYPHRKGETGNERHHGYLRAWVRAGADGRSTFHTIRPAPYWSRTDPAHIHLTVQLPGQDEVWIDDVVFEGDPLLTDAYRAGLEHQGGSGIVTLTREDDGPWLAVRDITLPVD
ncbi:MAG: intradiol ring-cleavage dioxygenase [Bacteroidota bacterium]